MTYSTILSVRIDSPHSDPVAHAIDLSKQFPELLRPIASTDDILMAIANAEVPKNSHHYTELLAERKKICDYIGGEIAKSLLEYLSKTDTYNGY